MQKAPPHPSDNWQDIINSTMNVAGPSVTPEHYHSSTTTIIDMAPHERIKVIAREWDKESSLRIVHSDTYGHTHIVIHDLKGGEVGAPPVATGINQAERGESPG